MNRYERDIGAAALRRFGRTGNVLKAVEEFAELQQALMKHLAAPDDALIVSNVHEEIADAMIMINRLMMLFDPTEVMDWRDFKLEKTARMLGMEEGTSSGAARHLPHRGKAQGERGTSSGAARDCCPIDGPRANCEGPEEPTGEVMEEMRL